MHDVILYGRLLIAIEAICFQPAVSPFRIAERGIALIDLRAGHEMCDTCALPFERLCRENPSCAKQCANRLRTDVRSAAMTGQRRTAISDGEIAWEESGRGTAVIFLHGFSFDRSMWDLQIKALGRSHRALRYDLRGFGESTRPSARYCHVEDLAFLLDSWKLNRAMLVGLSLGANIALEFASRFPDRIDRLALASPGLPGHVWTDERPPDQIHRIARESGVEAAKAFWMTHPIFASLIQAGRGGPLLEMIERYDGWHWKNADPRAAPTDLASRLRHIDPPTLVISGGKDAMGYQEIARRIAGDMPHAEIAVMPDAGHVMSLENPVAFNALLLRFLDQNS